jgi:hypothetical protein
VNAKTPSYDLKMSLILRIVLILTLTLSLSLNSTASALWRLESVNNKSGLSAYATSFWLQGSGAVTFDTLMSKDVREGTYWAILMTSCIKKKLALSIVVNQSGSSNRAIRLDDPGFANIVFDDRVKKRYRTWGSGIDSSIGFLNDAKKLVQEINKRKKMTTVLKLTSSNERILVTFDVSGLDKAKTRFRYAGCALG